MSRNETDPKKRRPHLPDRLPPLPRSTRWLLVILGWLLLLVGVAGLVLPGLQGILTLLFGAALLSLVSRTVLIWLRKLFSGHPRAWRKLLKMRRSIHRRLMPKNGKTASEGHTDKDPAQETP